MTIKTTSTINSIVAQNGETAPIFAKWSIDFCCGGHRSITTACQDENLSQKEMEILMAELEMKMAENPVNPQACKTCGSQ